MTKKKNKNIRKKNRTISWILAGITAYILLVNNSLEFLMNFGIEAKSNVVGVIMIFITLVWLFWKQGQGEL